MVTDELPEEDVLPDEEELEGREDSEEEDGTEALPLELLGWELELDDKLLELLDVPGHGGCMLPAIRRWMCRGCCHWPSIRPNSRQDLSSSA